MTGETTYLKVNNFFKQYGGKIIIAFILLYIITFCCISYIKYISFSYTDIDLSIIERAFWNTLHGKFVAREIGEPAIFVGGHFSLIILFLIPFYAIYAHPLTLLFIQTIALAVPAYFIYILARRKIDESFAFFFALAYLLYPALAYVNLFEFHEIAFAPLFIIPMFIFFDQRSFRLFLLFMFLSLTCKEDVSLAIFGLGIYAFFRYFNRLPPFFKKEDVKWIIIPLLSGTLWFIFVTQIFQPYFTLFEIKRISDPQKGMLTLFYGWLGRTPVQIMNNIFLHPVKTLKGIFIPAKNCYLLQLFGPLSFLSVFGLKEMIIVLFSISESLLSQWATHVSLYYQYSALVMPFIFISAIFGLKRLLEFNFFKRFKVYLLVVLFNISLFFAYNVGPLFRLPLNDWKRDVRDTLKERLVKIIPSQASVVASFELGTRLTHRKKLFFAYHVNISDWTPLYSYFAAKYGEKADYLLTDFMDNLTYFGFYHHDSDLYLKSFLEKYHWNVAYEIDNIALWTKEKSNASKLIETIDSFPEHLLGPAFGNEYIKFVGCELKKQVVLGYPLLHFAGFLECQQPTEQRFILQLDFFDKNNNKLLYRHLFVAADRIYPTKRWQKGEKIKIVQNVPVPASVKIENCNLTFSLFPVR